MKFMLKTNQSRKNRILKRKRNIGLIAPATFSIIGHADGIIIQKMDILQMIVLGKVVEFVEDVIDKS